MFAAYLCRVQFAISPDEIIIISTEYGHTHKKIIRMLI